MIQTLPLENVNATATPTLKLSDCERAAKALKNMVLLRTRRPRVKIPMTFPISPLNLGGSKLSFPSATTLSSQSHF